MSDALDKDVDDIISQLKNRKNIFATVEKENPNLSKEDVEKFVIDNAATVISDCVGMLQELRETVRGEADFKLVMSIAELAKATTSAIDALSKLKLSDDKIKAQKEIKQMDINAKSSAIEEKRDDALYLSREDLIKSLRSYKELPDPAPVTIDV